MLHVALGIAILYRESRLSAADSYIMIAQRQQDGRMRGSFLDHRTEYGVGL